MDKANSRPLDALQNDDYTDVFVSLFLWRYKEVSWEDFRTSVARRIAVKAGIPAETIAAALTTPPDPKLGDYAFPCFLLAKKMRKPPAAIAQELAATVDLSPLAERVEAAGPYMNLFVNRPTFVASVLADVIERGEAYGTSDVGAGKTVVVDYSSPNIAKHLGIHHVRTTMIGHAICNLYKALGYRVVGVNHLGDWGTQFGQLIAAYKRWQAPEPLGDDPVARLNELYVRFHKEAANDPSLEEEGRAWFRKLEEGDAEARALWETFRAVSLEAFHKVYDQLGIAFDDYKGESFYAPMTEEVIQRLLDMGIATHSEGAVIVNLEPYDLGIYLLRRSDGATLYYTRDICAAEYRKKEYDFDKMIYVVGSEQRLLFLQLFKVLEIMGHGWARDCVHVDFGRVKGMSTRRGSVVLLQDVIDEAVQRVRDIIGEKHAELENKEEVARNVGIGAIVFNDLKNRRIKDVQFDWEDVLSFDGETGPYVQYTHVRLCSLIEKYGHAADRGAELSLLTTDEELSLVKLLAALPHAVQQAAEQYEPSILSRCLLDLCSAFNNYYHLHRIVGDDPKLTRARILLVDALRQVIKNGLHVLGLEAPEKM